MANFSTFEHQLQKGEKEGWLSEKIVPILRGFLRSYANATVHSSSQEETLAWFTTFLKLLRQQNLSPLTFEPYHERVRSPFDYYAFGNDFFRPLIDKTASKIIGHDHIRQILQLLARGENVVFLANHQTEADPMALSILLDDLYPGFIEKTIFVAGERVITDPLAIPFSLGRNLLCIYSKKYISHPPDKQREKLLHNQRTMELMSLLLKEGGKSIYVAPSGGRDRRDAQGRVELAPFDAGSIEMFYLMAQKAQTPTHFYPMSLVTYDVLPPPATTQIELGEERNIGRAPIHLAIGSPLDMEKFTGHNAPDKWEKRKARAQYIWNEVHQNYQLLQNGKRGLG